MKRGVYHVPLDNVYLRCFITPFGKYAFRRLPFRLNVSIKVFQRIKERIFRDLNICTYLDDFIIVGISEQNKNFKTNIIFDFFIGMREGIA